MICFGSSASITMEAFTIHKLKIARLTAAKK